MAPSAEVAVLVERLRTETVPFETRSDALDEIGKDGPWPSGGGGTLDGVDAVRASLRADLSFGIAEPGRQVHDLSAPPITSPNLYVRWAQMRLLSAFAHVPIAPGGAPWDAGEHALTIFREYARLRYRLLPYLAHCARETAQQGLPMLRPLLLEFSWDPDAATIDDQFLLGRDVLVAPIFSDEAGPVTRRVYLPAYANWYDWWSGQLLEGRQWLDVTMPLERVPLYVRAGTAIPLADLRSSIGDQPVEVTRLLLLAPREGAIGSSIELPDGDLLGVEHERGQRKARIYIEGLPPTIRDLEIVGLPASAQIVDAASPRVRIVPGDGLLPGFGATWDSLTVSLDLGAYTTGLELSW